MIEQANSLLALMRDYAQTGDYWKSIPLAREYYQLIEQMLDNPDVEWNDTLAFCDAIFLEELLMQRDVPRLCLRFLALRNRILSRPHPTASEEYQELHLPEEEAQAYLEKLTSYIDPATRMQDWAQRYQVFLLFDPVEMTPRWEEVIFEVECECERLLADQPRGMGFCFSYWSTKRAVLARHGIQWKSPGQMNPRVMFD